MEQRDLIKDQIEQLGRVLGKIIADFLGLKTQGNIGHAMEVSSRQLKDELDLDVEQFLNVSEKELKDFLNKRHFTAEHIELLADYLFEIGRSNQDSLRYLKRSITLLDIADEHSQTISFVRQEKKSTIKSLLN